MPSGSGNITRAELLDAAPAIILAGAVSRTTHIRLNSAVTVLSAADPVRVFQDFATIDLISNGRVISMGPCCTNPLEDELPLTPDGFSLRLRYGVCQEL
jgi:hypothetical protein